MVKARLWIRLQLFRQIVGNELLEIADRLFLIHNDGVPVQLCLSADDGVIFEEISIQEIMIDQLKIDGIVAEAFNVVDKRRRKRDLAVLPDGTGVVGVQIVQKVGVAVRVFQIAVRCIF